MESFILTHYPIVGGVACSSSSDIRVKNLDAAIKLASKKHLSFSLSRKKWDNLGNLIVESPVKYVNYNGVLELV